MNYTKPDYIRSIRPIIAFSEIEKRKSQHNFLKRKLTCYLELVIKSINERNETFQKTNNNFFSFKDNVGIYNLMEIDLKCIALNDALNFTDFLRDDTPASTSMIKLYEAARDYIYSVNSMYSINRNFTKRLVRNDLDLRYKGKFVLDVSNSFDWRSELMDLGFL
ncbi:hypothetical protein [Aeromonas salmonicida]|nr:hypothetical protein [Aeromonas salmonicida]MDM5126081.1 hypothetical protein [Aeromonas salmonicida]